MILNFPDHMVAKGPLFLSLLNIKTESHRHTFPTRNSLGISLKLTEPANFIHNLHQHLIILN